MKYQNFLGFKRVHMVGVAGSGMIGIAEVLLNLGFEVSGSDLLTTLATQRLSDCGAVIYQGHDESYVKLADVVVQSTAVSDDNAEIRQAQALRIPIIPRAQMLAELMRFKCGVAVAGTHGKTTTTSMIASILTHGGHDPTYIIGGCLQGAHHNAALGKGDVLVAEADESDASFLYLQPMMAVVTNIDADHLETYQHDLTKLHDSFVQFIQNLPFYGRAIVCLDDPGVQAILPRLHRPMLTYGLQDGADVRGTGYRQVGCRVRFDVLSSDYPPMSVTLRIPGKHNMLNALAAIAVARQCGVSHKSIVQALEQFQGVKRRFEMHTVLSKKVKTFTLVDDYGHHPRELEATLAAVKDLWPDKQVKMLFQPHRYSRTHDLFEDFLRVLSQVDWLVILEVYSAGEQPISGFGSRDLCAALRAQGKASVWYVDRIEAVADFITPHIYADDVVLCQGAGTVSHLVSLLKAYFATAELCHEDT